MSDQVIVPAQGEVARYAGLCAKCGSQFYHGDNIYVGSKDGNMIAAHFKCAVSDTSIFDNLQLTGGAPAREGK